MRRLILTVLLGLFGHLGIATAADGELDPTFLTDAEYPGYGFYGNPNGQPNAKDSIGAIVERADKKLWAVGRMSAPGAYRLSLYLVHPDGSPDVGFGNFGLRTVVQPCPLFAVADAKLDAQGRLLVAIDQCTDFMVYRFLPNGDLDANFATGGVLTVAFNKGGSNKDQTQNLIIAPNGDVIVAGTVATATSRSLGIARYTQSGQPAPGFGSSGKVVLGFEWQLPEGRGVNGLHQMADGRILVTGQIEEMPQGGTENQQYVVRLLADGALDPSYGNSSLGISKVNHKLVLGVSSSPDTSASLMLGDGSIVQVGSIKPINANSYRDIFLMRWLPDGQLDTSIGLNGTRQYALDFAGPNAPPLLNWESARNISRQDNGDYVILAYSKDTNNDFAVAAMRLKSNFSMDTSFGTGGKIQHNVQIVNDGGRDLSGNAMILQKGRILFGGGVNAGASGDMQVMMGMQHDEIFAHTFD